MRARCARLSSASADTTICASIAYCAANFCSKNKKAIECSRMTITISEITDCEQWDSFLTSQPRGHLLQSYEWGELSKYLGGRIYRLGALENEHMVGAMFLIVTFISLPASLPGLHFK